MPVSASGDSAARLFDRQPHLVVPVDVVGRERHEPGFGASAGSNGPSCVERLGHACSGSP